MYEVNAVNCVFGLIGCQIEIEGDQAEIENYQFTIRASAGRLWRLASNCGSPEPTLAKVLPSQTAARRGPGIRRRFCHRGYRYTPIDGGMDSTGCRGIGPQAGDFTATVQSAVGDRLVLLCRWAFFASVNSLRSV